MKRGMARAARMPMITTTIINSIRVKPFWFLFFVRNMCSSFGVTVLPWVGLCSCLLQVLEPRPEVVLRDVLRRGFPATGRRLLATRSSPLAACEAAGRVGTGVHMAVSVRVRYELASSDVGTSSPASSMVQVSSVASVSRIPLVAVQVNVLPAATIV